MPLNGHMRILVMSQTDFVLIPISIDTSTLTFADGEYLFIVKLLH